MAYSTNYRHLSDEALERKINRIPSRDVEALIAERNRRAKLTDDQKADERHKENQRWQIETRRRSNLAIGISFAGVIVSIGSLVLVYLANKPIRKIAPDATTVAPSMSIPSSPASLSPTPIPSDSATPSPSTTPQPTQSPPLSPAP